MGAEKMITIKPKPFDKMTEQTITKKKSCDHKGIYEKVNPNIVLYSRYADKYA